MRGEVINLRIVFNSYVQVVSRGSTVHVLETEKVVIMKQSGAPSFTGLSVMSSDQEKQVTKSLKLSILPHPIQGGTRRGELCCLRLPKRLASWSRSSCSSINVRPGYPDWYNLRNYDVRSYAV